MEKEKLSDALHVWRLKDLFVKIDYICEEITEMKKEKNSVFLERAKLKALELKGLAENELQKKCTQAFLDGRLKWKTKKEEQK